MSERHTSPSEAEQQAVFDLISTRLYELFGPGGSFTISLARPTAEHAVFASTVSDTIAHDVATAFAPVRAESGRRVAPPATMAEHEVFWKQIEAELLIRRTGPDSVDVDVAREIAAAQVAEAREQARRAA